MSKPLKDIVVDLIYDSSVIDRLAKHSDVGNLAKTIRDKLLGWHKASEELPTEKDRYRVMIGGEERHAYWDGKNWRSTSRNIACIIHSDLITHWQKITPPQEIV